MFPSEYYSRLKIPKSHTTMYGDKHFRTSAPRPWNKLSNPIKFVASKEIGCKVPKMHLFVLCEPGHVLIQF